MDQIDQHNSWHEEHVICVFLYTHEPHMDTTQTSPGNYVSIIDESANWNNKTHRIFFFRLGYRTANCSENLDIIYKIET